MAMSTSFRQAMATDLAGMMGTGTDPVADADVVRIWRAISTLMEVDEYLGHADRVAALKSPQVYPAELYLSDAAAALARVDMKTVNEFLNVCWIWVRRRADEARIALPEAVA